MSLSSYARKLAEAVKADDDEALRELCLELEYQQLGKEKWPQEVFDFFVDALRDADVGAAKGSANLVMSLYNDFDKITPDQRAILLQVLDDRADEFGDEMLRHTASDMIARLYPVQIALKKFNEWMRMGTPRRLHMAEVGFEVLVMAKRLEPAEETMVRSHLQKLGQRKD
jgi:hypothetical protein